MPGDDGVLRVVKVRTKDGEYVRPVAKLYKLEENLANSASDEKINDGESGSGEKLDDVGVSGASGEKLDDVGVSGATGASGEKLNDNSGVVAVKNDAEDGSTSESIAGDDVPPSANSVSTNNATSDPELNADSQDLSSEPKISEGRTRRRRRRRVPRARRQYELRSKEADS